MVAPWHGEAWADGGIRSGVEHMGEAIEPWKGVALLDDAVQDSLRGMSGELWVFG